MPRDSVISCNRLEGVELNTAGTHILHSRVDRRKVQDLKARIDAPADVLVALRAVPDDLATEVGPCDGVEATRAPAEDDAVDLDAPLIFRTLDG